ncbi:MAG: GMC family oxidoreductase [Magnetospirillum sp.]|nr:GMC family oxidoreductase [Magnetospirillum sp.]
MIIKGSELPEGGRIEADVAIVGGGPAGITLALELADSGLQVLLMEGGGGRTSPRADSFTGEVADGTRHPPLTLYRHRGLGGASALWGGRCVPFAPVDFEVRPHIPWSGWPIGATEFAPWYARAGAWCESGPSRFRVAEALGPDAPPAVTGLTDPDIESDGLERFSRPTHFGRRYRRMLAAAPRLRVVVGAMCVGVDTMASGRAVEALRFAVRPGHLFTVRARAYVLAAGGLETTRLLLASGIGGEWVGRFYMCHLEGKAAWARFRPGTSVIFAYERDGGGVYLRRHFALSPDAQRRLRTTNVILRIEPPAIADPSHVNPVLSALWLSRTFLKPEYARKLASFGYRGALPVGASALVLRHLANVTGNLPELARFSADWLLRHTLARRKLPYVATAATNGAFSLDYNAEQVPNPESRVTLTDKRDVFGVPRLHVNWQVTPQDTESIVAAHRALASALARSGTGRLEFDEDAIRGGYNAIGGHHIGTARMADDPSAGVVDRDCRVFTVENLWLAGSAVFPTSSHANPTLTIVALAARLAAHLAAQLGGHGQTGRADTLPQAAE